MIISYKKLLNKNLLVLSEFTISSFSENYLIKMFINNTIPGLLTAELQMINTMPAFCYDITSRHSLSTFSENSKINHSLVSSIFMHLYQLCEALDAYMLDNCYIILEPSLIFFNSELKIPYFCYCPLAENNKEYSLQSQLMILLDYIICKLDYSDRDCVALTYTLHQKCSCSSFILTDLTQFTASPQPQSQSKSLPEKHVTDEAISHCDNNTNDIDQPVLPAASCHYILGLPPGLAAFLTLIAIIAFTMVICSLYLYAIDKSISIYLFIALIFTGLGIFLLSLPYFFNKRKYYLYLAKNNIQTDITSECDNTDFSEIMPIGDTVLINLQPSKSSPHLIYTGSDFNHNIYIDSFPFTVGKIPEGADCIIDNSLISRIHARFYFKDQSYYVEDMNSSNGTYLNGAPIAPHTMTEINHGDLITFAHLTYIFKFC